VDAEVPRSLQTVSFDRSILLAFRLVYMHAYTEMFNEQIIIVKQRIKAKFYYASWFEAGSKLIADRFEAKFYYTIWFGPASNQLRTN